MKARIVTVLCAFLVLISARVADAVVWTVINTDSAGVGSLKAAIDSANGGVFIVADTVAFAIPGAGPHVITRRSPLIITAPAVLIDGYSQSGASMNTLATGNDAVLKIVLTTDSVDVDAFHIAGDSCHIRGLVLGGWRIAMSVAGTSNCIVDGNFIGVDTSGTGSFGNEIGVLMSAFIFNRIGGTAPSQRNIISGNSNAGIYISGGAGGAVMGNYIGTTRAGTVGLPNTSGVYIQSATGVTVGGTTPGSGNLISANTFGIIITGSPSGAVVQGNLVGTDVTGLLALGNFSRGISILNSSGNLIGGTTLSARNVIAASSVSNIDISGHTSVGNSIEGNFIGTNATGLTGLSGGIGIELIGAESNFIGGFTSASRNVISSHSVAGIRFVDSAMLNTVAGNYIGVGSDGISPLGNATGIRLLNAIGNTLGPLTGSEYNIIANSLSGAGVEVLGTSIRNYVGNSVFVDNAGLAIDLGGDGVTPNDSLDVDPGPNHLTNFPDLFQAKLNESGTMLSGRLLTGAGVLCLIQVYHSTECDPSGHGEGAGWLDSISLVGDAVFGLDSFAVQLDSLPLGTLITATSLDGIGNTSEFSNCVVVEPPDVNDTLRVFLFSPVSMVVTDPMGDSIGVDSASGTIFNTILNAATYDTTTDANSPDTTGPDGSEDDIVTIPHPLAGDYQIRLFVSDTTGSTSFTMGIRINGNQLFLPDDYQEASITALGGTISPVFAWTAATTLPGDANANGTTTSADIIYLVNHVFKGGPDAVVPGHGDVDCSGAVTAADIIRLVNYVFKSGLPPCSQSGG